MKGRIAQRAYYAALPSALTEPWTSGREVTGRRYADIDAYRCDDADEIIVAMGTIADTARAVVDVLRGEGRAVGAVGVTSYRPFPADHLAEVLGRRHGRRRRRADRRAGRCRQPADSRDQGRALCARRRRDKGAAGGLGVRWTRIAGRRRCRSGRRLRLVERRPVRRARSSAVVGIRHPLAVPPRPIDISSAGSFAVRGHSIGGLGSITTNKLLATRHGRGLRQAGPGLSAVRVREEGPPDELLA